MGNSSETLAITPRQQQDIELAASHLAAGLNPMELDRLGRHEEAKTLGFVLGEIDEGKLGHQLDARVKQLKENPSKTQTDFSHQVKPGEKPTPLPMPPSSPQPEKPADAWQQTDFLNTLRKAKQQKPGREPKKYQLEELHRDNKMGQYPRAELQRAEAGRDFQKMKKRMGFTQKRNTKLIQQSAEKAIQRLEESGVWPHIASCKPLTPTIITKIQASLQQYDQGLGTSHTQGELYEQAGFLIHRDGSYEDLDSSDGIIIFSSEEAWQNQ